MRPSPTTRAGRRGNTLIETAMVLPLMILLVLAVLDYGLFLLERHLINDLARDGAHQAAISTKRGIDLPAQLQARLRGLPGSGSSKPNASSAFSCWGATSPYLFSQSNT